jgi:beta-galactosidase
LVETLAVRDARVLARFTAGPAAGEAAITCAEHGAGAAYYVATLPDAAGRSALVDHLLARRGIEPVVAGLAPKVEACARGDVVTVINHSDQAASVAVPGHEPFVLQPFGYRVLR